MAECLSKDAPEGRPQLEMSTVFYFADLFIQVENTLYKVNRRDFEHGSEVFATMFQLPSGDAAPEGGSAENPLVLESVKVADMNQFLWALYPPRDLDRTSLGLDEWRAVLKLAKMWGFSALITESLAALRDATGEDPIAKVKLYREFDLDPEVWFFPAIIQLVYKEDLTLAQLEPLGIDVVIRISTLRGEGDMYTVVTMRRLDPDYMTLRIRELWGMPMPAGTMERAQVALRAGPPRQSLRALLPSLQGAHHTQPVNLITALQQALQNQN